MRQSTEPKTPWLKAAITRFLTAWMILSVLLTSSTPASAQPQAQDSQDAATRVLAGMTTQERIGQLFMVTFNGRDIAQDTDIYKLIADYQVGGVVLRADKDNFTGPENTIETAKTLITGLQQVEYSSVTRSGSKHTQYVPLLIGLAQDGDGYPNDQILSGLTSLPSQMTLGATWKTEDAQMAGMALGKDLASVGVNLLIGPSLDVLDSPVQEGGDDLNVRSFGGDPFWVGKLGKAFIKGVHDGSKNRVSVFSKNFPGRGSADRPLEQEVATVRKSLEQLKQIELAPFFAVTSNVDATENTDGLFVSHIRYQGFQGNIRATTKPVSLDSTALTQIMALPEFAAWRESGGVIMTDNLGSQALRRFSDPSLQTFDAIQTARTAFMAGNDLLYVDNFAGTGDENSFEAIKNTLDFFTQRYNLDPAFAERVNQSVLRILMLKLKLYPEFDLVVVNPQATVDNSNIPDDLDYLVAQNAVTLINPSASELMNVLPDPPGRSERMIFFMDSLRYKQCTFCEEQVALNSDALEKSILEAYGPSSGNQVVDERLSSYSFQNLMDWMDGLAATNSLEQDLRLANWVVVGILDTNESRTTSKAFKRFLEEKADLIRDKHVVVFAFNAPYYLDATDISKITAYYGIFCKSASCINVARSVLFQDLTPRGSSPVSIAGVGYDLITATSPDPNQVIELLLDLPEAPMPTISTEILATLTPIAPPEFKIGDTLPLKTGVILDHNGHPVPDGTVVRFVISQGGDLSTSQQIEATSTGGIAYAAYKIAATGFLQIHVVSEPAQTSNILQLDVSENDGAIVVAVEPTAIFTSTPTPTDTVTPTAGPNGTPENGETPQDISLLEWLLAVVMIAGGAFGAFMVGSRVYSTRWGIRWGLFVIISGMLCYLYLVFDLPGASGWLKLAGTTGLLFAILLFMAIGWMGGFLWHAYGIRKSNHNVSTSV